MARSVPALLSLVALIAAVVGLPACRAVVDPPASAPRVADASVPAPAADRGARVPAVPPPSPAPTSAPSARDGDGHATGPSAGPPLAELYLAALRPRPRRMLVVGVAPALVAGLLRGGVAVDVVADPALHDTYRALGAATRLRIFADGGDGAPVDRGPGAPGGAYDAVVVVRTSAAALEDVPWFEAAPLRLDEDDVPRTSAESFDRSPRYVFVAPGAPGKMVRLTVRTRARPPTAEQGFPFAPLDEQLALAGEGGALAMDLRAAGYLVGDGAALRLELGRRVGGRSAVVYLRGALAEGTLRLRSTVPGIPVGGKASRAVVPDSLLPVCGAQEDSVSAGTGGPFEAGRAFARVVGAARFLGEGPLRHDPRRRGRQWEIEVTKIDTLLEPEAWGPVEIARVRRLGAIRDAIRSGDIATAALEATAAHRELRAALGPLADVCVTGLRFLADLSTQLSARVASARPSCLPQAGGLELVAGTAIDQEVRAAWRDSLAAWYRTGFAVDPAHPRNLRDLRPGENTLPICWRSFTAHDPQFPRARVDDVLRAYPFLDVP